MGMPPTQRKSSAASGPVASGDCPAPDHLVTDASARAASALPPARESGGPGGPEPTRFGDWEKNGRCIDF
jgi:hypothetical protein